MTQVPRERRLLKIGLGANAAVDIGRAPRHSGAVTYAEGVVETTIEAADAADRRPGAAVTAKIHCGRRTLGYVWWHEAWRGLESLWF